MTAAASDTSTLVSANAAASASLRETAKWLIGGVAATSAGIFAGSSLTHLGSLDFAEHAPRLTLAIAGGLLGFLGLAIVFARAIAVMTVESVGLPTLVSSHKPTLKKVRDKMNAIYGGALPGGASTLKDLIAKAEQARLTNSAADRAFLAEFRAFYPKLMAEAGFEHVSVKFAAMIGALKLAAPLLVLGFGVFAWAANPPDDKPATKKALIVINQP